MNLALMQAHRALGNTKQNPAVGCVIVKNDCVISSGYTSFNGRPHAEHNAIKLSKKNVKNSDLYVTLEPCSHQRIVGSCVKKIISKKIGSVFFSIKDPDLRSHNKSANLLRGKNIFTKGKILCADVNNFYKSYYKYKKIIYLL